MFNIDVTRDRHSVFNMVLHRFNINVTCDKQSAINMVLHWFNIGLTPVLYMLDPFFQHGVTLV